MKVGPLGIKLLHHFESCALTAYKCPAGVRTIGWGMTYYPKGGKVLRGDKISQEDADAMFEVLLERDFTQPVLKMLGKAKTTPAQFGALVAFAYNVGTDQDLDKIAEGLGDSTLLKLHLKGDYAGAAKEFLKWNKSGGKVLAGLTRRRKAEAALYTGDFAALAKLTDGEVT